MSDIDAKFDGPMENPIKTMSHLEIDICHPWLWGPILPTKKKSQYAIVSLALGSHALHIVNDG